MARLKVGEENGSPIEIHFEDHGAGRPVVLIHGWPMSGRSWESQVPALVEAGHRVVTYDRRGFGSSSQPWGGYDYDAFTADLDALLRHLDLREVTASNGTMASASPWMTNVGTVTLARSPRKSVRPNAAIPALGRGDRRQPARRDQGRPPRDQRLPRRGVQPGAARLLGRVGPKAGGRRRRTGLVAARGLMTWSVARPR